LTAMALRPGDRYRSALDLAAEAEHWLADEPVSTYHEPAGARARRWVRKHARVVTGLAVAVAVALLALGLLAWQSEHARQSLANEQAETLKERDRANAERDLAREL